jgi:hypothetical protein
MNEGMEKKQEILSYAVQEYERIVKFLTETESYFSPGILRINTKDEYSEYGDDTRGHWEMSFTLSLQCPSLQVIPYGVICEKGK